VVVPDCAAHDGAPWHSKDGGLKMTDDLKPLRNRDGSMTGPVPPPPCGYVPRARRGRLSGRIEHGKFDAPSGCAVARS
jgi:hypothetical protein